MNSETPNNDINTQESNKKNLPIIIAAVIAVILGCAAGSVFYWINRPINKVETALENNYDIPTVNQYYDKLNYEDQRRINTKLLDYAEQLYDEYYDGDKDYDTVDEIYDDLEAKSLGDDSDFEELRSKLDELRDSRANFREASDAFASGDYVKAMTYCALVSELDPDYEKAQTMYEDSRQLNVIGEWTSTLDIANAIAHIAGYSLDNSISVPVEIICTFNADGTGGFTYNIEDYDAFISSMSQLLVNALVKQLAASYGVDESALDSVAQLMGFSDILSFASSYMGYSFDMDSLVKEFTDANLEFTYTINDNSIELNCDETIKLLHFEEDGSLTMDQTDAPDLFKTDTLTFVKKTASF